MSVISEDELPFDEWHDQPDDMAEGAAFRAKIEQVLVPADHPHWIKFYVDGGTFMASRYRGSRNTRGVYWSMLCEDPSTEKPVLVRKQDLQKYKTNNDAEWLAVREALQFAVNEKKGTMPIIIYSDSMLVVNQFNGKWRAKIARHHRLRTECTLLAEGLKFVVLQWVPREVNVEKLGH